MTNTVTLTFEQKKSFFILLGQFENSRNNSQKNKVIKDWTNLEKKLGVEISRTDILSWGLSFMDLCN